jgi:hypothetical protein
MRLTGPQARILGAVGVVAALTLVVVAVWAGAGARRGSQEPVQTRIEPAQPTQPLTMPPVPGADATSSAEATASHGATEAPEEPLPGPVRAKRIAFRLGGTLYVADEDGTGAAPVARIDSGPYALSPDGFTIAAVSGGRLRLVDVASGAAIDAGPAFDSGLALGECPAWAPDSSHLIYVRSAAIDGSGDVWRVGRDGRGAKRLASGGMPSVSPTGHVVAVTAAADEMDSEAGAVLVSQGGVFRRVVVKGGRPTALAVGDDRLYVGVLGVDGTSRIVAMGLDGTGAADISGPPPDSPRATWGALRLSPTGRRLAAVATGDDQYSRIGIIDLSTETYHSLHLRRDGYPKCWSSTGRYLYYVEGNTYQGEATTLMRVERDGTGRRALVTGAE